MVGEVTIYQIRNLCDDKRYIGSSRNLVWRWKSHRKYLNLGKHSNRYLQRAWRKHGELSFAFEVLDDCSERKRRKREQFWVDFYDASGKGGYNMAHPIKRVAASKRMSDARHAWLDRGNNREILAEILRKRNTEVLNKLDHSSTPASRENSRKARLKTLEDPKQYEALLKHLEKLHRSPEHKAMLRRNGEALRDAPEFEEYRKQNAERLTKHNKSDKHRKFMCKQTKKQWRRPGMRKKMGAAISAGRAAAKFARLKSSEERPPVC